MLYTLYVEQLYGKLFIVDTEVAFNALDLLWDEEQKSSRSSEHGTLKIWSEHWKDGKSNQNDNSKYVEQLYGKLFIIGTEVAFNALNLLLDEEQKSSRSSRQGPLKLWMV